MKVNLSLAAILSTTAIASGVLFTSVATAQPCSLSKYRASTEQANQVNWLNTPLAAALTIPGIALAVSLYMHGRSYQN
ncbi:hypothetical protein [Chroococcidiopsis sp. CCMEE 29]|uniref:hypothetical protein n=1 Tax=Chroococcidiopsis sp. CCMEE 29 TaxID=155894 RepID=UPI002021B940|nr:hypothetical protein [Chroococcidiopsis sp. CCMEE 29]